MVMRLPRYVFWLMLLSYTFSLLSQVNPHLPTFSCVQYTGIEAQVRKYFPEGYHLAYMVLGGYATIIALSQIKGSFSSAAKIAAIPAPEAPDYHTRAFYHRASSLLPKFLAFLNLFKSPIRYQKLNSSLSTHTAPPHLPGLAIVVSNDIPSFGTPEWEAFIEKDSNNFQVWLEVSYVPHAEFAPAHVLRRKTT